MGEAVDDSDEEQADGAAVPGQQQIRVLEPVPQNQPRASALEQMVGPMPIQDDMKQPRRNNAQPYG